ncbi:MAG: succinyl-diaminopimelate desuccinylase, partial [Pseudomonadota bacterium]
TDVVPTGPVERWSSPPFAPTERDGKLYGRGAADMKSGVAAMVTAAEAWLDEGAGHGTLAFLLTSDEEGPARDGTRRVIDALLARGERIDWCVIGEPSSQERLGDVVRIGRRGSLTGRLTVRGRQGHVAYPHKARNPIHDAAPALAELTSTCWDDGNAHFPPTSFQIAQVMAGTGAANVIPGHLEVIFNFRHSTESTVESLQGRVMEVLRRHGLAQRVELRWDDPPSPPFLSTPGPLADAVDAAVRAQTGLAPQMDTGGGTSDGRFIAPRGIEVAELGPVNASIHQIDEHIALGDLGRLAAIYLDITRRLLPRGA